MADDIISLLASDGVLTLGQLAQFEELSASFADGLNNPLVLPKVYAEQQRTNTVDNATAASQETMGMSLPIPVPTPTPALTTPGFSTDTFQQLTPAFPGIPTPSIMIPDQSMGPFFDPRIGWYFPAIPMGAVPAPRDPYPKVSEGYVPLSPMPSGVNTPSPPRRPQKKKPDPVAALHERIKQRVAMARKSLTVLPFEVTKDTPVAQNCICAEKEKIKRPKNAWILYRLATAPSIATSTGFNSAQEISKIAAERWKKEPETVRQYYFDKAEEEKARHKEQHPDYKYVPGAVNRYRFGSVGCTCGAYQANMAHLGLKVASTDKQAEGSAPQPQYRAPVAEMTEIRQASAPFFPNLALPGMGKRKQAAGSPISPKRKCGPDALVFQEHEEEPANKRRSPRQRKSVVYTEPSEEDDFSVTPAEQDAALNANMGKFDVSAMNFGDMFTSISPAYGTRSGSLRNKASSPKNSSPKADFSFLSEFDFDNVEWEKALRKEFDAVDDEFSQPLGEGEDLFGEPSGEGDEQFGGDIDEEATTAARRPSSRDQTQDSQGSPAMGTRSRAKSVAQSPISPKSTLRRSSRKSTSQ